MKEFDCDYDEVADVLYTWLDKPEPATCQDDGAGCYLRTSMETGKPCGVTVLDFKYTYGQVGLDVLCFNIQHFLQDTTLEAIKNKLYSILDYKEQR